MMLPMYHTASQAGNAGVSHCCHPTDAMQILEDNHLSSAPVTRQEPDTWVQDTRFDYDMVPGLITRASATRAGSMCMAMHVHASVHCHDW